MNVLPGNSANTIQAATTLAEEWVAAELRGDASVVERLLADDFMAVGPRGFLLTKADWLQRIMSGSLTYSQLDWDEVAVRVYGDTSVVIGCQTQKATYQDHPIAGQFRVTLVSIKQQGHWRLISLQLSPIAGPLSGMPSAPPAGRPQSEA